MLCKGDSPESIVVHYKSSQQRCPAVVAVVSPEVTPTGVWRIESEVVLGEDCDYTIHLASRNGAGQTNSTGTLSIS